MYLLIHIPLFFDISGGEFMVIILFALLFFGSKNIPDLMRGLGRGYREFKNAANSIKDEISKGTEDVTKEIRGPLDQHFEEINEEIKKDTPKLDQ
jgi:sec-independent protein translocase protein TatA